MTDTQQRAVEVLADKEHESWSNWQAYLQDDCCTKLENGDLLIPASRVEHWKRQINTPYADLSEFEKESDRNEVRRALAALHSANLVILDRETVKLAVRWGEFVEDYGSDTEWTMTYDAPALKQMQDALGGGDV